MAIIAHKEHRIHWAVKLEHTTIVLGSLNVSNVVLDFIVHPTQHHVPWSVPEDITVPQELKHRLTTPAPRDILTMRRNSKA